jgi:hypothetical protein
MAAILRNEWLTGLFLVEAQRHDRFRRGFGRERIGPQVEPLDVTRAGVSPGRRRRNLPDQLSHNIPDPAEVLEFW